MQQGKRAITPDEMRQIERRCYAMGIPPSALMEAAGTRVAEFVRSEMKADSMILFVCGTGNNGGDGFVAARELAGDYSVVVALIGGKDSIKHGAARNNFDALLKSGVRVIEKAGRDTVSELSAKADAVVCAIFGTGFHGTPPKEASDAIEAINKSRKSIVIAVDVPSGMDAKTGEDSRSVVADYTVTFHAVKTGLLASRKAGKVVVADIGIPEEAEI